MCLKKSVHAVARVLWLPLLMCSTLLAQGPAKLRKEDPPMPVDEIISRFSEKEKSFRIARANYTYHQTVRVQNLNENDRVLGEYYVVCDKTIVESVKGTVQITKAPHKLFE